MFFDNDFIFLIFIVLKLIRDILIVLVGLGIVYVN